MATKKKMLQAAAGAVGGDVGAWDLSYAYYTPINTWDLSFASNSTTQFNVSTQEAAPSGVFLKPDGLKMYITGTSGDDVNEYSLSTAWAINTASYVQNFSVSAQDIIPRGLFFKPDGAKMYIVGDAGNDINEYDLSTAWDISTASFDQSFNVLSQDASPIGMYFRDDGLKMYVAGNSGSEVNEYNVSTAWDISTASFLQRFSVASQQANIDDVFFRSDGIKMFIIGRSGADATEYTLSTAWDISTCSFESSYDVSGLMTSPTGFSFKPDGSEMYVIGTAPAQRVVVINLGGGFSVASQELYPNGVCFALAGSKMYVVGTGSDTVYEYDLSTAWDTESASYNQGFSVSSQDATPRGLFFREDGLKMYIVGQTNRRVYEYNLSTAGDVSTASFSQSFEVTSQEFQPMGVFFKPDGTKMYIIGQIGDEVNEYDLSTAWDVTSSSFNQLFSVAAQETNPRDLFFREDGLKMYIVGVQAPRDVNEYDLSTGWDISTASFTQAFNVFNQVAAGGDGLFFKNDGTKMYVTASTKGRIFTYALGVQE